MVTGMKAFQIEKKHKAPMVTAIIHYLEDKLSEYDNDYLGLSLNYLGEIRRIKFTRYDYMTYLKGGEEIKENFLSFTEVMRKISERWNRKDLMILLEDHKTIFEEFLTSIDQFRNRRKVPKSLRPIFLPVFEEHSKFVLQMIKTAADYGSTGDIDEFRSNIPGYLGIAKCHEVAINECFDVSLQCHQHHLGKEAIYCSMKDNGRIGRDDRVRVVWEMVRDTFAEDPELSRVSTYSSNDLEFSENVACPYCGHSYGLWEEHGGVSWNFNCDHFLLVFNSEESFEVIESNDSEVEALLERCYDEHHLSIREAMNEVGGERTFLSLDRDTYHRFLFYQTDGDLASDLEGLLESAGEEITCPLCEKVNGIWKDGYFKVGDHNQCEHYVGWRTDSELAIISPFAELFATMMSYSIYSGVKAYLWVMRSKFIRLRKINTSDRDGIILFSFERNELIASLKEAIQNQKLDEMCNAISLSSLSIDLRLPTGDAQIESPDSPDEQFPAMNFVILPFLSYNKRKEMLTEMLLEKLKESLKSATIARLWIPYGMGMLYTYFYRDFDRRDAERSDGNMVELLRPYHSTDEKLIRYQMEEYGDDYFGETYELNFQ